MSRLSPNPERAEVYEGASRGHSRRVFLGAAAAGAAILTAPRIAAGPSKLAASPPKGFSPLSIPGKVVKVTRSNTLQPNGLWPLEDAARLMFERAMTEFTGKKDLASAFSCFVHRDDKVVVKANGIAGQKGQTMATNKELILEVVRGLVAAGVPAASITILEQYPSFLWGTRVVTSKGGPVDSAFPAGVKAVVHENKDASMADITVRGIGTRFVRAFTEATAVINVSMIKDHSICGYTGCLKNITHGSIVNPHAFHQHRASPQIAELYAQDLCKSRVRLHITDGFKVIYDGGPLDKNVKRRVPHEAVYVATDPVAMDVIGWQVVEAHRKEANLPTLKAALREPDYIRVAGELGLGIYDSNQIRLRQFAI